MRTRTIALAILAVLVQSLGSVTPADALEPITVSYTFTGAAQVFDVPLGVSAIQVDLVGGRGGTAITGAPGGFGARVGGGLAVDLGQRLYVLVGGNGPAGVDEVVDIPGGFNGGGRGGSGLSGGGGGASDVRSDSASLASRMIVAAGAGGGGTLGFGGGSSAGAGGSAGSPGQSITSGGTGGGAGTTTAGGAGGSVGATGGALGVGGDGAPFVTFEGPGGGGGGGYFGGGGGGAHDNGGGGGGGGSSFTGSATNPAVAIDSSGVPSVSITYTPTIPPSTGAIDAVVTMAVSAACLELSTTSIDFGTRTFGEVGAHASPFIDVANCGGIAESVLVRGTNAQGPESSAWSLVDTGTCADGSLGSDAYRLTLGFPSAPSVAIPLSTENTEAIVSIGGGSTIESEVLLDTPCPGSTGAGQEMAMQILFVAVEAVP